MLITFCYEDILFAMADLQGQLILTCSNAAANEKNVSHLIVFQ